MAETDRKVFAICVTAAFVFWLILNLSQDYTVRREVQLNYLVDPERVLVGAMPGAIETDVSGSGWALIWEGIRPGALPVEIDVREQTDNRLTRPELEQQIQRRLSSGDLTVSYMEFESIPILTTPLGGKRVPIIARINVETAPGFIVVDSLYLSPDSVTINAANDVLEEIEYWETTQLNLTKLNGRSEGNINLAKPKSEDIRLGREETLYSVRAEPFIQRVIQVPVTVINAPEGERYEITPASIDVTVSVAQSAYERVNPADFKIIADVGNRRDGSFSPSVALEITERPRAAVSAFLGVQTVTYYAIR